MNCTHPEVHPTLDFERSKTCDVCDVKISGRRMNCSHQGGGGGGGGGQ